MGLGHIFAKIGAAAARIMTFVVSPARFGLVNLLERNPLYLRLFRKPLVEAFNKTYYYLRNNTLDNTRFMGKHLLKFPTDLWTFQEIIFERKPDVIVETGVFLGGSTYYFSKLCSLFGHGRVIAIDITLGCVDPELRSLTNVTLIEGSTTDPAVLEQVRRLISPEEKVMVVLDSDHTTEHVYAEMNLFAQLVSEGQYLVVEDGLVDRAYPVLLNRGPLKAIKRFLRERSDFVPDHFRNRFLLTQNPWGFLLKGSQEKFATPDDCLRPFRLWLPLQQLPKGIRWLPALLQNEAANKERN